MQAGFARGERQALYTGEEATQPENRIDSVPSLCQYPAFPTGCESVSAVMLLSHYGVRLSPGQFIDRYLPCAPVPTAGGFGASPWEAFLGDPRSEAGWGCYAPVIAKAMNRIFHERQMHLTAQALLGVDLAQLCRDTIAEGNPALIWATSGMARVKKGITWHTDRGSCTWISPMYCLLLVGNTASYYIFNDSQTGCVTYYEKEKTEKAYTALGCQAVVVTAA